MRQRATFVDTAAEDPDVVSLIKALESFHVSEEDDRALRRFRRLPVELKLKIADIADIKELFETTPLDNLESAYLQAPDWARSDAALAAIVVMRNPRLITSIEPSVRVDKDFIEAVNTGIYVNVRLDNLQRLRLHLYDQPCILYKNNHGDKKARFLNKDGEMLGEKHRLHSIPAEQVETLVDLTVRVNQPGIFPARYFWPDSRRRLNRIIPAGTRLSMSTRADRYSNNFLFVGLTPAEQKQVALNLLAIDIDFIHTFNDQYHFDEWRDDEKSEPIARDRDVGLTVLRQVHNKRSFGDEASSFVCAHPDDRELVLVAVQCGLGDSLCWASDRLKNDKEIVKAAMRSHNDSLKYASPTLQHDPELLEFQRQLQDEYIYGVNEA